MESDRLRRAEAEAEALQLREDVERLEEERLRLTRRNERLISALYTIRDNGLDEALQYVVEDALGFDGREPDLHEDLELSGFNLLPNEPVDGEDGSS
jgi:hypothetical protein